MVVFLIYFLPMVLPSLIYVLWRLWRARRPAIAAPMPQDAATPPDGSDPVPDGSDPATAATPEAIDWRAAPWLWLVLAGVALLVLVLLTGVFTEGAKDEGRYLPPRMENGRIVPGEMRPSAPGGARPDSGANPARPNDANSPP